MKKINNKTFYKYSFLSNLTANDCGDKAIFVRQTPNEEKDTYDSNLYIYKNKEVSKLTSCNSAGQAFWYDDKTVAFTSKRDESEKPKNKDKTDSKKEQKKIKLYKKDTTSSAESEFFLELEGEISNIKRLANGKLVYLKKRDIREADSEYFSGQEDEEGYMRIRRIPFYSNGTTFTFNKITALCVYDIEAEKEEEITCEDYSILSYDLSLAKDKILIIASKLQKKYLSYTALFEFDVKANELKKVLDDDTYSSKDPYGIYAATYLENKVLFLGSTMKKHGLNENKIAYTIEKDGEIKTLNSKDVNYLNSGIQDMELASGDQYRAFDSHVDFITTIGIINKISRLHSDGKFEEDIFLAKGGMSCFDYVDDKILYIGLEANSGQEIYLEGKKISNFHSFLDDYYVAIPEIQNFKSTDFNIDGFVLLPEDYNEKDEFPAVLEIHGGPKAAYQPTYFHEMQMLASEGYVVMYCNPRGSAGKGNVFQDIFGMYGTVDYENIMDFVDLILQKYDKINKDRLFVTGGSYGGYMTNVIIGRTDIFKAAVTQRCISNWMSMYGTSDIGYYFSPDQIGTSIEKDTFWQDLWDVSPLKNADNIKTPTMIIHSANDFRCPLEQGYQLFTALVDRGIDTEFLVFKGEHHGLSRGGKPKNRIERLEGIRTWFEKYDKK